MTTSKFLFFFLRVKEFTHFLICFVWFLFHVEGSAVCRKVKSLYVTVRIMLNNIKYMSI